MTALSFAALPTEGRTLTVASLTSLLSDVAQKPNVQSLSLEGNSLPQSSLRLVEAFLISSTTLTSLNLAMCTLGDAGAVRVVRACCSQRTRPMTIKHLDLSLNGISDVGCADIGRFMRFCCSPSSGVALQSLVLNLNPITATGALALLRANTFHALELKYCCLLYNGGHDDGTDNWDIGALCQGVRENTSLRLLAIEGNGLEGKHGAAVMAALRMNSKSSLSEESVTWGSAVGELPSLERLLKDQLSTIALQRAPSPPRGPSTTTASSTQKPCRPPHLVTPLQVQVSEAVLKEAQLVLGESVVVRGQLRDRQCPSRRQATALITKRPTSVAERPHCVEVSQSAYARVAVARSIRSNHLDATLDVLQVSRELRLPQERGTSKQRLALRCTPAPGIGRVGDRMREVEENKQQQSRLLGEVLTGCYVAPTREQLVEENGKRAPSRGMSQDSRRGESPSRSQLSSASSAGMMPWKSTTHPRYAPHGQSKGRAAKMILDRALVGDDQCLALFPRWRSLAQLEPQQEISSPQELSQTRVGRCSSVHSEGTAPTRTSQRCRSRDSTGDDRSTTMFSAYDRHLPEVLATVCAVPSHLNSLPMCSEGRVRGIAKLLWTILHSEDIVSIDCAIALPDLPPHVALSSPAATAKYRSQRSVENTEVRKLLEKLRDAARPTLPTSNEIRARAASKIDCGGRSVRRSHSAVAASSVI